MAMVPKVAIGPRGCSSPKREQSDLREISNGEVAEVAHGIAAQWLEQITDTGDVPMLSEVDRDEGGALHGLGQIVIQHRVFLRRIEIDKPLEWTAMLDEVRPVHEELLAGTDRRARIRKAGLVQGAERGSRSGRIIEDGDEVMARRIGAKSRRQRVLLVIHDVSPIEDSWLSEERGSQRPRDLGSAVAIGVRL